MPKLLVTIFFLGAFFTTNAIAMSDSEKQRYVDFVKENLDQYDDTSDIVLGFLPLIEDEISAGRLIRPWRETVKPIRSYFLVYQQNPTIKATDMYVMSVFSFLISSVFPPTRSIHGQDASGKFPLTVMLDHGVFVYAAVGQYRKLSRRAVVGNQVTTPQD